MGSVAARFAFGVAVAVASGTATASAGIDMSPEAFRAMSEGRTLYFSLNGDFFGAEQYFRDGRTLWYPAGGPCEEGVWRPEGDLICFEYAGHPEEACWRMQRSDNQVQAVAIDPDGSEGIVLDLEWSDDSPLPCPGPDVGS